MLFKSSNLVTFDGLSQNIFLEDINLVIILTNMVGVGVAEVSGISYISLDLDLDDID